MTRPPAGSSGGPAGLSDVWLWILILLFGLTSSGLIRLFDSPFLPRPALLGLATGSAAVITALVWFAIIGARRDALWVVAMLVPYVNLVAASYFARRSWTQGARAPALLAIAGMVLQTLASLRVLAPLLQPLV